MTYKVNLHVIFYFSKKLTFKNDLNFFDIVYDYIDLAYALHNSTIRDIYWIKNGYWIFCLYASFP